jgi:S1-C subfamily serine protease
VDTLDIILVVVILLAAIHGLRLGAAVQVLSFAGALIGLGIGIGLVILITPHVHSQFARTFTSLLLLILPSAMVWGVGRQLGVRAWRHLRGHKFAFVDSGVGAVVAVAGTLVVVWLLASVLVNSQVKLVSTQIENSRVLRAVANVMPPIPNELATVERLLDENGFPLPYIGLLPPSGPVALPRSPAVREAVIRDGRSTVQVIALGCGNLVQYGSGFVVAPGLVVTNAHVIAGTDHITVKDQIEEHPATAIYFDPRYDLAVLRVPSLTDPPLHLDPNFVARGTKAVVMGYPGGGPFNAQAAGVLLQFDPVSTDIYGDATVQRQLYEIQSLVRPGNSGGPLAEPGGTVIGVVFSRESSNDRIGFALTSRGVLARVRRAESLPAGHRASTGACIDG